MLRNEEKRKYHGMKKILNYFGSVNKFSFGCCVPTVLSARSRQIGLNSCCVCVCDRARSRMFTSHCMLDVYVYILTPSTFAILFSIDLSTFVPFAFGGRKKADCRFVLSCDFVGVVAAAVCPVLLIAARIILDTLRSQCGCVFLRLGKFHGAHTAHVAPHSIHISTCRMAQLGALEMWRTITCWFIAQSHLRFCWCDWQANCRNLEAFIQHHK